MKGFTKCDSPFCRSQAKSFIRYIDTNVNNSLSYDYNHHYCLFHLFRKLRLLKEVEKLSSPFRTKIIEARIFR